MNSSSVITTCLTLSLTPLLFETNKDPHFWENRNTIVHLFEWRWKDIALECELFLQHRGYGGVQISPPNENLVITNRPWWERYQPVSYKLVTRSGNEAEFLDMTRRCNAVGVRIYADVVFNHMTARSGVGTAKNYAFYENTSFPAVPYDSTDFHKPCGVKNYQDPYNVRNCRLKGLVDLDQSLEPVRKKIIQYLNGLIHLGVAGFRIDAAKHMWPKDLGYIYSQLDNLNVNFGFNLGVKPFIYQEVIDYGGEAITKNEYTQYGRVVEFKFSYELSNMFRGNNKLTFLETWGPSWGILPSDNALAFIDNHDTQRSLDVILTYKQPKQYKMAVAFMLAHPYGITRIISSYSFDNKDQGPPADSNGNLIPPNIRKDGTCSNGYVCEHRWRQIYNMVEFRNVVRGSGIHNWWSDGNQQLSFCRGNKGFVVFTNFGDVDQTLQTCLPEGVYCDVISGGVAGKGCSGKSVSVGKNGLAHIYLGGLEEDGVLAIHVRSRIAQV